MVSLTCFGSKGDVQITNMAHSLRYLLLYALFTFPSFNGTCASCGHPCPFQWVSFGDHCYLLVLQSLTWADAETYCQQLSSHRYGTAHLLWINSQEEHKFVTEYVERYQQVYVGNIWLGLNDIKQDGVFVWTGVSGSPVFTWWYSGYPYSHSSSSYDCAYGSRSHAWHWLNTSCSWATLFVCKV